MGMRVWGHSDLAETWTLTVGHVVSEAREGEFCNEVLAVVCLG